MSWDLFKERYWVDARTGLSVDVSRMGFGPGFFAEMEPALGRAFAEMAALEGGAIANADEKRMVGHYWLRAPERAPTPEIRGAIEHTVQRIKDFAAGVHSGHVRGERGAFRRVLIVGIGGSALGPQFVAAALTTPADRMRVAFFDNTDPDGMDLVLAELDGHLDETLTVVTSKSGGTKETRNGMLEAAAAYQKAGLTFARHAVAVTGAGSELDQTAEREGWIARFPMWDWVGGRTSELSAVGLLPAALQGLDIGGMLAGAAAVDELTRVPDARKNPAALLALMWWWAGKGRGEKDMVVLPYKDRLLLFSRYLQQLVMESLGKEQDRKGRTVRQGIAVYGNKGSTDQHAYVQQLREGLANIFVTFIRVAEDRRGPSMIVGEGATSGDYLLGFLEGTRAALSENGRESITIGLPRVDAASVGGLIALYERTVGLYASLIDVNAYHQPGVEAGKKAAGRVLALQGQALAFLRGRHGPAVGAEAIAAGIGAAGETELVWKVLEHAADNGVHGVVREGTGFESRYRIA
jgi:glucose-6-phosphate isomerase